jgi:IS30 family transposase
MNYKHLTENERREIDVAFNYEELSMRQTAQKLGVSPSTISREIKKGKTKSKINLWIYCEKYGLTPIENKYFYRYSDAQIKADKRLSNCHNYKKIVDNKKLRDVIIDWLINRNYKPDVIAGRLKREYATDENMRVCSETIYSWLFSEDGKGYIKYLAKGKKKAKKKRGKTKTRRSEIKRRNSIKNRSKKVDNRQRLGDYEADTVVSPHSASSQCLVTLVDRMTRKMYVKKIFQHTQDEAIKALKMILTAIDPEARKTVTFDNGVEFHKHYELKDELGIDTYFADPYSSWQRGTNERHNGLIRRFFPKKTDFKDITDNEIDEIVNFWNNYPRKILGYKTPNEAWDDELGVKGN